MTTTPRTPSPIPQACILPTAEQPLRLAEFDALVQHAEALRDPGA